MVQRVLYECLNKDILAIDGTLRFIGDRMKKKVFSLTVLGLSVILILSLTLQSNKGTGALTNSALQVVISSAEKTGMSREEVLAQWWANPDFIRKLAHIPEYFILGFASLFVFRFLKIKNCINKSFVFCLCLSILDQTIKGILPTREFDITDLPIDFLGYGIGIFSAVLLISICRYILSLRNKKKTEE